MNNIELNLPCLPVNQDNPKKTFLDHAKDFFSAKEYQKAFDQLCLAIQSSVNAEAIYELLIPIISFCTRDQIGIIIGTLPKLFDISPRLIEQQGNLAVKLGEWCEFFAQSAECQDKFLEYLHSMDYYVIAMKIAETNPQFKSLHDIHLLANRLFLRIIQMEIKQRLEENKGKPEVFCSLIASFASLDKYLCCETNRALIQEVYFEAGRHMATIKLSSQNAYQECLKPLEKGAQPFAIKNQTTTEAYRSQLIECRAEFEQFSKNGKFDSQTVRNFQHGIIKKVQAFFDLLLTDLFIILGKPPCGFDLRALGSMGRQEFSPFSDLEFMILLEKEQHRSYFDKLVRYLNFQLVTLGESEMQNLLHFTCLGQKQKLGFRFDRGGNPLSCPYLMGTPKQLADLQKQSVPYDLEEVPIVPPNQVLRSESLYQNDPHLFEEYQIAMEEFLTHKRFSRAMQLFSSRANDFHNTWKNPLLPNPINIKKSTVELIHFLLGDMALYWGLREANTLDIIDALTKKGVFVESTSLLLKEAVSAIYALRIRIHGVYQEQREDAYLDGLQKCFLNKEEKNQLEKTYWLILRPVYHFWLLACKNNFEENQPLPTLDVISILLNEIYLSHENTESFLTPFCFAINHLAAKDPKKDQLLAIFTKLSTRTDFEILRQTFVDILEKHGFSNEFLDLILNIPNRAGLRLSFRRNETSLLSQIEALTNPNCHSKKKVSQVKITSSQGERFLNPEIVKKIIADRNIINAHPGSSHRVTSTENLHFKQKPTQPLMEYAIHNLLYRLAGNLTPASALVRFEVDNKIMYPVLVSTTIPGTTLKERLKGSFNLTDAQWRRWSRFLLTSILIKPGDGLPSNYILDQDNFLFCIDNDISFVEPVVKWTFTTQVHFCSALFCLFQTKLLDRAAVEEFCSLDADAILQGWMDDVIQKEKEYLSLFSEKEREILFKLENFTLSGNHAKTKKDPDNQFKATILFREGTLANLSAQFVFLQNRLQSYLGKNQMPTCVDLLKSIISLNDQPNLIHASGHKVSTYYSKSSELPVEERLKWINSRSQTHSLSSLKSDLACLGRTPTYEEVERKMLFSPGKAKEELAISLLKRNNQIISIGMLNNKEIIQANFQEIKDGTNPDIERQRLVLKSLIMLLELEVRKPVSVTLQHCMVLDSQTLAPFLSQNLEYLDVMYSSKLKNDDLKMIHKICPNLKELNLRGCTGLTEIKGLVFENLKILTIGSCPNLKKIQITSSSLYILNGHNNPLLSQVNISNFLNLENPFKHCPLILYSSKSSTSEMSKDTLPKSVFDDKDFMMAALKQEKLTFKDASKRLRGDRELAITAIEKNRQNLVYIDDNLKNDKDFMIYALKNKWLSLELASEKFKNNREIVLEAVKVDGMALRYASHDLKHDAELVNTAFRYVELKLLEVDSTFKSVKEYMLLAIQKDTKNLAIASPELQNDEEVVLSAIKPQTDMGVKIITALFKGSWEPFFESDKSVIFRYAGDKLKRDGKFVLKVMNINAGVLQYASDEIKGDKEFMLAAIQIYGGYGLRFASHVLQHDYDVVLAAVKLDARALEFGSNELKKNHEIVLQTFTSKNWSAEVAKHVDIDLWCDSDFILEAVKKNGCVLQFTGLQIKKNFDIVLAAVKNDGCALQYSCEEFKNNFEIALNALLSSKGNYEVYEYIGVELRANPIFFLEAVKINGCLLKYGSVTLQDNFDIVLAAVQNKGNALEYASLRLKNSREIVLQAVQINGMTLKFASDELKNDREIVTLCIQNSEAIHFASAALKNEPDIILLSLRHQKNDRNCQLFLEYAGPLVRDNKEVVMEAILKNPLSLQFASDNLRNDPQVVLLSIRQQEKGSYCEILLKHAGIHVQDNNEVVIEAIQKNAKSLQFASDRLRNDIQVVREAVIQDGMTLQYASNELRNNKEIVIVAVKQNRDAKQYIGEELKEDPAIREYFSTGCQIL